MIESSKNMTEHKVRVFLTVLVGAFIILGVSSCAHINDAQQDSTKAVVAKVDVKKEDVKKIVVKKEAVAKSVSEKVIVIPTIDKTITVVKNAPVDPLILDYSYNTVWLASLKAVKQVGLIKDQEMMSGHIIARIRSAIVDINIEKIDAKKVRLKVSAIKDAGKDNDLAADIFQRIQKLAAIY